MRLYVLYNRSNRLLFVMVSGFVIEFAVALVTAVQSSIFDGQSLIHNLWKTDCERYCLKSTLYPSQQLVLQLSRQQKKSIYILVILQW